MTLPASGQIAVSDISVEIGQAPSYSTNLNFLNNLILASQRPATPAMNNFYSKAYFQNNAAGNCANGNCTGNCNCGNIQCTNCVITGGVNCTNCDSQSWLQTNCNCACTYNCTTGLTSYNCNCACNCSKIICAKLYEFGMMDYRVWLADQQYGEWLKKYDRAVYKGYIKWAKIVTSWMDGNGPDYLVWIKDKEIRSVEQKRTSTEWAQKIGTPWAEHMAFLMGALPNDNLKGRVIMAIGRPICKLVNILPKRTNPGTLTTWLMWSMFFMSHYVSESVVRLSRLNKKIKSLKIFNVFQGTIK
jgi:hypothetical protein